MDTFNLYQVVLVSSSRLKILPTEFPVLTPNFAVSQQPHVIFPANATQKQVGYSLDREPKKIDQRTL